MWPQTSLSYPVSIPGRRTYERVLSKNSRTVSPSSKTIRMIRSGDGLSGLTGQLAKYCPTRTTFSTQCPRHVQAVPLTQSQLPHLQNSGHLSREECIDRVTEKCATVFCPVVGFGTPVLLSNMLYAGLFLRESSGSGIEREIV
jgi:hypothetical protein